MNIHLYNSPFQHETRILKITESLRDLDIFSDIVILALYEPGLAETERLDQGRTVRRLRTGFDAPGKNGLSKMLRLSIWAIKVLLYAIRIRRRILCINCHILTLLPLCVLIKAIAGCKLVYDTHELETETANSTGVRRIIAKWVEAVLIRHADAVVVVNEAIGQWYRRTYGLQNVTVVHNAPRKRLHATRRDLRKELEIVGEGMLFLYLGILGRDRCIELLVEVFTSQDRSDILFVGYGEMVSVVKSCAARSKRIHFLPAVAPADIGCVAGAADIGICFLVGDCLNYRLAMPNKLFEYLASGLPVLANDDIAVGAYVSDKGCGWSVPLRAERLAHFVRSLEWDEVRQKRAGAAVAAREVGWCYEERALAEMYHRLGFGATSKSTVSAALG